MIETMNCPRCNSDNVIKFGNTYGKQGDKRQRYGCVDCQKNGRAWTFPEFYKRKINDIHTCSKCEEEGIDSNMIRSGIYKWGEHKGEQRFICTTNCKHVEFEHVLTEEELEQERLNEERYEMEAKEKGISKEKYKELLFEARKILDAKRRLEGGK